MVEQFERLYLTVFLVTAASLLLLERIRWFQRAPAPATGRWSANLGLLVVGNVLVSLLLPIGAIALAQGQSPRLLGRLDWPPAAQVVLTFLLIDLWRYWEHRLYHRVEILWRLHLVHHSDVAIDVTTAERHHPIESLLSTAIMLSLVAALGLPAMGIAVYVLVASVIAFVTHANLRIPVALDRLLCKVVVTPAAHRFHHSASQAQTDSNFGAVLTLWDRCFGTWSDPSRSKIEHIGLEYFHRAQDAGLWQALGQPFLYRRGLVQAREVAPELPNKPASPRPSLPPEWPKVLRWSVPGLVLALVALYPTFAQLMRMTAVSEAYQYSWLVIPMLAYLLGWHWRAELLALKPQPGYAGLVLVALAAALWAVAALVQVDVALQFALVLALQGMALSMLGWHAYRRLFPVLALLFFLVPLGDLLLPALRLLTVRMMEAFAALVGMAQRTDGFVVHVADKRYIVLDECAGLTSVLLSSFVAYSLGLLLYRSFFKVAALGLLGALLGIACNGLRVNAIVLIDSLRGTQMDVAAHGPLQWLALLAALGILFVVLYRLRGDSDRGGRPPHGAEIAAVIAAATAPVKASRGTWLAPLIAGATLLATTSGMSALAGHVATAPRAAIAGQLPASIGGWKLAGEAQNWVPDPAAQSQSLARIYHRDDGGDSSRAMQVTVVETRSTAVKLPEAVLLPPTQDGWRAHRIDKQTVCAGTLCYDLRHAAWQRARSKDRRELFYLYASGGQTTDSRLVLRLLQGWQRLQGGGTARLIVVAFDGTAAPPSELAAAFNQLQKALDHKDALTPPSSIRDDEKPRP